MTKIEGIAGERLRSFVERIERLQEEKAAIALDIREVKAEAKGEGFDVATINRIIADRKLDAVEREEREALYDIYRAALGMLHDTPLGEAARRRLAAPPGTDAAGPDAAGPDAAGPDETAASPEPAAAAAADIDLDEARHRGTQAAQDGVAVTANPFVAGDPRRAAWDEAWCKAAGSDGMDIPAAWRRTKPVKEVKKPLDDNKGDDDDGNAGAGE